MCARVRYGNDPCPSMGGPGGPARAAVLSAGVPNLFAHNLFAQLKRHDPREEMRAFCIGGERLKTETS